MHKYDPSCIKNVAIVGARGYSGLELARILLRHPGARLTACLATDTAFELSDYLPEQAAATVPIAALADFDKIAAKNDVIFLATPADASMKLAPQALAAGASVVDLSGAFRLDAEGSAKWYGASAEAQKLLSKAQYGLVPWAGPVSGEGPKLISNPGCYATSVLLALLPLLKAGLVDSTQIVIDAKSGTSGAGRKAQEDLIFTEVEGECLPYKVGKHQHLPEITKYAQAFAAAEIDPMFVTHLLPVRRGIISGLYLRTKSGVTAESVQKSYSDAYSGYSLVKAAPMDEKKRAKFTLKRVVGSARCEIGYQLKDNQLYVFSMIDNLLKGAASQAVENFNRISDFPLTTALEELEGVL